MNTIRKPKREAVTFASCLNQSIKKILPRIRFVKGSHYPRKGACSIKAVQAALPKGHTLRALRSNDYERGFLKVLEVLTEVGNHTKEEFTEQFNYLKSHNHEYHTVTITDDASDTVVAVGTVFVERKFIRKNGLVGHIEDIAVDKNQQGKKLGLRIIQALKYIGAKRGCYKVILDCSEKNVPFYEKCGFSQKEVEMAWYVPTSEKARL